MSHLAPPHPSPAVASVGTSRRRQAIRGSGRAFRRGRGELEYRSCLHLSGIGADGSPVRTAHASSLHGTEEMPAVRRANRNVDFVGQNIDGENFRGPVFSAVRTNRSFCTVWPGEAAVTHSRHVVAVIGLQRELLRRLIHPDQCEGFEGSGGGGAGGERHSGKRRMRVPDSPAVGGGKKMAILSFYGARESLPRNLRMRLRRRDRRSSVDRRRRPGLPKILRKGSVAPFEEPRGNPSQRAQCRKQEPPQNAPARRGSPTAHRGSAIDRRGCAVIRGRPVREGGRSAIDRGRRSSLVFLQEARRLLAQAAKVVRVPSRPRKTRVGVRFHRRTSIQSVLGFPPQIYPSFEADEQVFLCPPPAPPAAPPAFEFYTSLERAVVGLWEISTRQPTPRLVKRRLKNFLDMVSLIHLL